MSQNSTSGQVNPGVPVDDGASPNEALAKKVIAALIDAKLVSPADGEAMRSRLAMGTLDESEWKLAFENQLEREAGADERK